MWKTHLTSKDYVFLGQCFDSHLHSQCQSLKYWKEFSLCLSVWCLRMCSSFSIEFTLWTQIEYLSFQMANWNEWKAYLLFCYIHWLDLLILGRGCVDPQDLGGEIKYLRNTALIKTQLLFHAKSVLALSVLGWMETYPVSLASQQWVVCSNSFHQSYRSWWNCHLMMVVGDQMHVLELNGVWKLREISGMQSQNVNVKIWK